MDNKKLEKGSRYEAHDLDGDGIYDVAVGASFCCVGSEKSF